MKQEMKQEIENMWKERFNTFYREASRYWSLIASSGLLFTVSILVILGVIYYRDFLAWIPTWVPIPEVLAVLIGFMVTKGSHRTFLKEADLLFLIPLEKEMDRYFHKVQAYNLIVQCIVVFAVLLILSPLYSSKVAVGNQNLWFYFLIPLLLKGWNLHSSWITQRVQDDNRVLVHVIFRFMFNTLFLLWFFKNGSVVFLIGFSIAVILFYIAEKRVREKHAYHWLKLLDMERSLQARYYSFINFFVDVPHLQSKVKKRAWISGITKWLPFHSSQAYRYLYLKTFFRANEYFGIYVRLTVIGAFIVYWVPDIYAKGLTYILFLLLTGTQIRSLWGHHARQFWQSIFPLSAQRQKDAFIWLHFCLLLLQGVLLVIPFLVTEVNIQQVFILLVIGGFFVYINSYIILAKKLTKRFNSR
jgi:ABC-2 type transport system permease protein